MKIGDYVRTEKGTITKYNAHDILLNKFENRYYYTYDTEESYSISELVVKSSPSIIDLIEVGDIITTNNLCGEITKIDGDKIYTTCYDGEYCSASDIKSIVTKEQFESMEYKVGE